MGSTMACYKYTHRGFSTLNSTPTHILVLWHKYTVRVQTNVCLDEHVRRLNCDANFVGHIHPFSETWSVTPRRS